MFHSQYPLQLFLNVLIKVNINHKESSPISNKYARRVLVDQSLSWRYSCSDPGVMRDSLSILVTPHRARGLKEARKLRKNKIKKNERKSKHFLHHISVFEEFYHVIFQCQYKYFQNSRIQKPGNQIEPSLATFHQKCVYIKVTILFFVKFWKCPKQVAQSQ